MLIGIAQIAVFIAGALIKRHFQRGHNLMLTPTEQAVKSWEGRFRRSVADMDETL